MWPLLLLACNGADPRWDLYPLRSYGLADVPAPRLSVQRGADGLRVTVTGELPCPIPLSGAVRAAVGDRPAVALDPGGVHGTGLGSACLPPNVWIPRDAVGAGDLALTLSDGDTLWTLQLGAPFAPRGLEAPARVARDAWVVASVSPPVDRWVPGPETRLTLEARTPAAGCTATVDALVGEQPVDPLTLAVPDDFCLGPAWLALSTSARRSAVLACPTGVVCAFDPGGYVVEVEVVDGR